MSMYNVRKSKYLQALWRNIWPWFQWTCCLNSNNIHVFLILVWNVFDITWIKVLLALVPFFIYDVIEDKHFPKKKIEVKENLSKNVGFNNCYEVFLGVPLWISNKKKHKKGLFIRILLINYNEIFNIILTRYFSINQLNI